MQPEHEKSRASEGSHQGPGTRILGLLVPDTVRVYGLRFRAF